ncbi:MAG: glycosyltransferase family 1 protein, partial [Patescibacteria group bacterium]
MKIGIDCRIFSPRFTGLGRYTSELVNRIVKLNNELVYPHTIVLFFNTAEYQTYKTPKNVEKVLVNAKHYSIKEQTVFLYKLYKAHLDLAFFPHFNAPIFYRRPYVVTIHDLTLSFFHGRKMTKWYHRLAYNLTIKNVTKKAEKILTISKNTKQDLIKILNINPEKIEVIYNGVSPIFRLIDATNAFAETLKKYKIKSQFLLYAGVWRSHKNLARLIEAFSILKKEKNLNLQLVITGKPDPYYPEVRNTVKKFDLQDDVIFTGLVDEEELLHLYNAAHIFVFPSLYEGFGLPPLEAMRCGTPVVASNTSSIPEICGKENAVFFNPYNIKDIA